MAGISDFASIPTRSGAGLVERATALLRDRSEAGSARRLAALAFGARVMNAGLGFVTQILLARWMGEREYGVYAYVWVWLLVAGGVFSLGLPVAALKFVPDYAARNDLAGLRGFLSASRTLAILPAVGGAAVAALLMWLAATGDAAVYLPVAMLALVVLPIYVLTDVQTGIARAYDFADLGLAADYLLRPGLLLVFVGIVYAFFGTGTAVSVMAATLAATALTALMQGVALQSRLGRAVPNGARRYDTRRWVEVSWPLLTVTGFTLLLGSTDVIVLKLFVGPEDIAIYFAATKIVAVASFVSYGVSNTSAHRFAGHMATGDRTAMARLAAETVRWTFWPTLAVAGGLALLAGPLLSLFGPNYQAGNLVVAILGLGLAAGATVGPADRALAMADHGRITAAIFAISFLANLVLALALTPIFGLPGAAAATALAMVGRAAMLFVETRRRLGLDMFVFSGQTIARPMRAADMAGEADGLTVELLDLGTAEPHVEAWRQLERETLEPNVFYSAETTLAAMRHLPEERGTRVLAAWRNEGGERRLVGLLPLRPGRGRRLNPFGLQRAAECYGTLSTPLLHPDRPEAILQAMLAHLASRKVAGILLPFLHAQGRVATALGDVAETGGLKSVVLDAHRRALLSSALPGSDYIRATLEPRRRKEADRQRRRLGEEGALTFSVARSEAEVADALEAFLDLEAAGWKGEAGTDLKGSAGGAAFIRETSRALAADGRFRVATLSLAGRPIAAGLLGLCGRRAFYQKTAYDESLARFSPGLLLTLDLTAHLLDDPEIDAADSIAVADHPMIDRVWTERFPVATVMISTRPGGGILFGAAVATERLRERGVAELKRLRARFRRSAKPAAKDGANKPVSEASA